MGSGLGSVDTAAILTLGDGDESLLERQTPLRVQDELVLASWDIGGDVLLQHQEMGQCILAVVLEQPPPVLDESLSDEQKSWLESTSHSTEKLDICAKVVALPFDARQQLCKESISDEDGLPLLSPVFVSR